MQNITELPAWEQILKKIIWKQLGEIRGKTILDFGSGEGISADHFAKENRVIAIEPDKDMLEQSRKDPAYRQITGDVGALSEFEDSAFDIVLCHNVLEYIDDKKSVVQELTRVLKPGGVMSVVKHNRGGRIMQTAVLSDDFEAANALLDGKNDAASESGEIRYYEDEDIHKWVPELDVVKTYGIRTFWDLQQNREKHTDEEWQDATVRLDMRVSQEEAFQGIAFFHHLILRNNRREEIEAENPYMREAIAEALRGIHSGHGGPFGCVIVKDGKIVGRGHNKVLALIDSTAHGEISAIRNAEKSLGTYDLSGCELYTTGEPCPMCLNAILWANIEKVYYGCTISDNAGIGFRDEKFDRLSGGREAFQDFLICIDREACHRLYEVYSSLEHRIY